MSKAEHKAAKPDEERLRFHQWSMAEVGKLSQNIFFPFVLTWRKYFDIKFALNACNLDQICGDDPPSEEVFAPSPPQSPPIPFTFQFLPSSSNPGMVRVLVEMFEYAVRHKDGTALREMADGIDAIADLEKSPDNPLRSFLLRTLSKDFKQVRYPTFTELLKEVKAAGLDYEDRTVRRNCEVLGIKLKKGQPGRPRKSRTK